jgi:hypothetical protein
MRTTDAADLALDFALTCLKDHAAPWRTRDDDLAWLRQQFQEDFKREIKNYADYKAWEPRIGRLFTLAGALAKFFAEARHQNVNAAPGRVKLKDMKAACAVVKLCVCPTRMSPRERREICRNAPFLNNRRGADHVAELLAELVHVRQVFCGKA